MNKKDENIEVRFKNFLIKESVFVSKDEVDELLDKISSSGINSLSDIEKNRLTLFSEKDKEIIKIIEEMGDITNEFRELNKKMNKLSSEGKNKEAHSLMRYWIELNDRVGKDYDKCVIGFSNSMNIIARLMLAETAFRYRLSMNANYCVYET
jgi:hypothetical protein